MKGKISITLELEILVSLILALSFLVIKILTLSLLVWIAFILSSPQILLTNHAAEAGRLAVYLSSGGYRV